MQVLESVAGLGLLAVTLSALIGCGTVTSFTPTNTPPRPMRPRPQERVAMFTSSAPTRPFVEVGLLSSGHEGGIFSGSTDEQVMLGLREKAAEVGCDAVLLQSETSTYYATSTTVSALKRFRAVCILYTDENAVAAPPESVTPAESVSPDSPAPAVPATGTAPTPVGTEGESCRSRSDCAVDLRCLNKVCSR